MSPVVIDVRRAEDGRDVVHRAVQALVEGQLVVFPTETVYGVAASALHPGAVQRLLALQHSDRRHGLSLAVRSADCAWDYVPGISAVAHRLGRRCWPGPVTLVLPANSEESLLQQLPELVRQAVCPETEVALRVPAHDVILDTLDLIAGPLVLATANPQGPGEAIEASAAIEAVGAHVRLVLDDGPSRFGDASSVIRITHDGINVLREGVVSRNNLKRLASLMVILVCTGNTCRSPMAEMILKKQLASKLGFSLNELEERGVVIFSAGCAAINGAPASAEAIHVMRERHLDLSTHSSQPLSERMVKDADLILTMTGSHLNAILQRWPDAGARTMLLSPDGRDVSDPIGGPLELYEKCADQIANAIAQRMSAMDPATIITHID